MKHIRSLCGQKAEFHCVKAGGACNSSWGTTTAQLYTLSVRDDEPSFGANMPLTLGSFSMHSKQGNIVLCTQI